jgi:Tol biopolymer transport system component
LNRSIQEPAFALWRFSVGLAIALRAGASLPKASAAEEEAHGTHGKIVVYAQFITGDRRGGEAWGLHLVDPATNTWTRIAEYPVKNGVHEMANIRVSPDAKRLAFNGHQDHHSYVSFSSVWLLELSRDAAPRKISDIGGRPIWSPDGKKLLVVEVTGGGPDKPSEPSRFATWKIDDDGSHPVRLPIPGTDMVADWSSDGRWLVGVSPIPGKEHEHAFENVILHPDGTGRRQLPGPGVGWQARFSPDGKRIAYVTGAKDEWSMKGKSIWVVDLEGKNRRSICMEPENGYIDDVVTWSPDGKQLATILRAWTHIENGSVTPKNPRLCIFNVEDRRMRIVPHPPATLLGYPEWR